MLITMTLMLAGTGCQSSACQPASPKCAWSTQYGCDRAEFEVAGHKGFAILPSKERRKKSMPWVWYAPTFVGTYPCETQSWIGKRLLAQGIAICGIDVGESYGSPRGRAAFTQFHEFVIRKFGLSAKSCLWAQSRGGLMLFNWAAEHPELVKCIGGTYPVCDIRSYPGLIAACSAYGMTGAELQSHLTEHNPIDRLAPIAARKVPILLVHGDSDKVVPLEANSAVLADRYKALGGPVELSVVKGKGHAEIPEFFECQELVDFFVRYALAAGD